MTGTEETQIPQTKWEEEDKNTDQIILDLPTTIHLINKSNLLEAYNV